LINQSTNIGENIVVADPSVDPSPSGYVLIGIPDESPVCIGWLYDPATGQFTNPALISIEE
jgi:hypothetical protein